MTCQTFEQYLVDYLERTLSSEYTRGVDAHLQQCEQCRDLLAQEQTIAEQLQHLPAFQCPDRVLESVFVRVEREQQSLSWRERIQGWFENHYVWKMGATVAAMLVLAVMAVFYRGGGHPPVQSINYTAEEIEQAKRDIELTLAYVGFYTQQAGHIVEQQLAATHNAVMQPVQKTIASQLQSTRNVIRRPLEEEMTNTFNSLIDGVL